MTSLSENTTASEPRSRRVGIAGPPEDFRLSTTSTASTSSSLFSPPSPSTTSPPIPPRSPLRPTAKAAPGSPPPPLPLVAALADELEADDMLLLSSRSMGSLSDVLDKPVSATARRPHTPNKPLPLTPQPSNSMPLSILDPEEDDETLVPSTSARSSVTAVTSKRTHALLELLSSERAYASDLALIRDIHIPLALGQPAPFAHAPATPPGSSGSSSRTLSTVSDSSAASSSSACGPAMTVDDAKIIFTNVEDLASFADAFSEALEDALGEVLDGGSGEDTVGRLFLEMIPRLEPLYRTYITKHPTALEHLSNLPQTPALTAYLAQTRTLASSLSHAWDLPSLLIKPVQRLLKYPLLLATVIEETPDSHGDKLNLRRAREKMEEVARGVNEGRRRREVVREVLTGIAPGTPMKNGDAKPKKKGLNVGVAASVSLGRMKSLSSAAYKAKEGAEANQEAESVKQMGENLKRHEEFMERFAKETVKWAESVRALTIALDEWAQSFGRVIWMGSDVRSEAFDAFLTLISNELLPVCDIAKQSIEDEVLPQLTQFSQMTNPPLRLLEAMHTLEPLHYGLLNLNYAKSRPPPQLLEASQSYVALRAQLFADLPQYLLLLDKGLALNIIRFARVQGQFYSNLRNRWADLWDALKVDEEANAGAVETLRVWWDRFREVEVAIHSLNIAHLPEKRSQDKARRKSGGKQGSMHDGDATQNLVVSSVLSALDPLNIPASASTSMFTQSPGAISAKTRSVNSMDIENQQMASRRSSESLHSKKSGKSRASSARGHSMGGATLVEVEEGGYAYPVPQLSALTPAYAESKPSYSRTKSMPLASSPIPLKKSQSHSRLLDVPDNISPSSSNPSLHSVAGSLQEDSRGRPSRKPSFRRRLTDSFRASTQVSSETRHRRSPSLPSEVYSATPSPIPSPNKATFAAPAPPPAHSRRKRSSAGYGQRPVLYECRVIHPCEPPAGVSYRGLPFFTLRVDDVYDILREAGHPSTHRDLPLYVDDGEDCLLLARDLAGNVGWVLASFLLPVD
ncbi:Dynamin-binding protein [Trametes pubescens]|uniref:Dynamin-binding protein n=1 Tax=Trametes pubescens TaxID=154538 RepID=A0A1M2VCE4_TRAPU|nr:Dynamin-binding protein [Trametes pubescens]